MSDSAATRGRRPLTLGAAAALLSFTAACDRHVEASKGEGSSDHRAKVTVAIPLAAQVAEAGEYVARTEAPERVEIRARVNGPIIKAAFREGELVKKGDLLFVIDPQPYEVAVERARAELQSVRTDRALAQRNLERAEKLRASNAIAERDLDTQTAQVAQLAAREAVAAAAVAAAQLDLDHAYVRSPIAGRVGRRLLTVGNLVGPSTPQALTTVVSVDPLYVYLDVEEARGLTLPRKGSLKAKVGFPGEEGYPREAPIDFLDNHVDAGSGTVKVRAVVANHDGRLSDGAFARVRLPTEAPHPALLVSDRAVATDQDRRFVWVVGGGDKAEYRPVKLGALYEGLRVVREGLREGDRVIVRGLQRVRPGAPLAPDVVPMRDADSDGKQAAK